MNESEASFHVKTLLFLLSLHQSRSPSLRLYVFLLQNLPHKDYGYLKNGVGDSHASAWCSNLDLVNKTLCLEMDCLLTGEDISSGSSVPSPRPHGNFQASYNLILGKRSLVVVVIFHKLPKRMIKSALAVNPALSHDLLVCGVDPDHVLGMSAVYAFCEADGPMLGLFLVSCRPCWLALCLVLIVRPC
ncbi:hypothetical protein DM01DRAFT_1373747 [Hesseltinella vesiculosa]|uniref:Uncharacterized protein n=1 Tax=Hesseltinella vesiculosa TaxID=101127 RepID=A0A1X2GKM9_9FUNG|nr:hypothetical protein DM01DRAFT_1373747 [Hesseltinella vesiculosa]